MASQGAEASTSSASVLPPIPRATSVLVIGMAGSGKSTFAGALAKHVHNLQDKDAYVVNLDPAVGPLNYEPNVDIRDTIDYKRVMEEYNLGPNGGILTALNLFTTKFDQVLGILENRSKEVECVLIYNSIALPEGLLTHNAPLTLPTSVVKSSWTLPARSRSSLGQPREPSSPTLSPPPCPPALHT